MNNHDENDKYEQAYQAIKELNSHGLNDLYTVIKGIALNRVLYHENQIRSFNDLDILISPSDAQMFHNVLNSIGYFQSMGPTSTNKSASARAFLALYSDKVSERSHAPYPIKTHQDKVEYKAYTREDSITIELHDGFHFIPEGLCSHMLKNSIEISGTNYIYKTLSLEHSFLTLIANAYENSESFYSNTYDFGVKGSDYVDIEAFFRVYKDANIWDEISSLIDEYRLNDMVAVVLNNLKLICGRDVTNACLPDINLRDSRWGIDILKRMDDTNASRKAALSVMRARWREASHPYYKKGLQVCDSKENVKWTVDIADGQIEIQWFIPKEMYGDSATYLYQVKIYPLDTETEYTLYKIDFGNYGGDYCAYGHSTKKYTMGAVKKKTKTKLRTQTKNGSDSVIVSNGINRNK